MEGQSGLSDGEMTSTKPDQVHGERRVTSRLPCHLAVSSEGTVIGQVEDVSLDGIRLSTTSQLLPNYSYKFQLRVPVSKQAVNFLGKILYRSDDSYGVKIEKMDRKSKGTFEKFVVSLRESCQIRDIILSLKTNKATLIIEDGKTVRDLLLKARDNNHPLKISLVDHYQPLPAKIAAIGTDTFSVKLSAPRRPTARRTCL